ncbi:MAG: ATP-binding protein [Deltaproteobacteria bacterium]|nr:ATP-binding protein [Deltaproteobacteria bacterium]
MSQSEMDFGVAIPLITNLASIFEDKPEIVLVTDLAYRVIYVNLSFEKRSGFDREEVIGRGLFNYSGVRQTEAQRKQIQMELDINQIWNGSLYNKAKDGSVFRVASSIFRCRNEEGLVTHHISVQRDLTALEGHGYNKAIDNNLESMGLLAGGIAHDLNNTLTPIMGFAELIRDKDTISTGDLQRYLKGIIDSTLHARDLVRRMLAVTRGEGAKKVLAPVDRVFSEVAKLAQPMFKRHIGFHRNVPPSLPMLMLDSNQVTMAILNIVINATHAMPHGGDIHLDAEHMAEVEETDVFGAPFSGEFLRISISDTGTGINPEVLRRVFDPFFTTKDKDTGTGLGLFMVRRIMETHNGRIMVHSQEGRGTSFSLFFPVPAQRMASGV